jgi:long-chain acyl-CoA synthetase
MNRSPPPFSCGKISYASAHDAAKAMAAVLRAGFTCVNVNPLYTPRELEHQLKDSGATAIILLENFAHTLQACKAATPVQHMVLCTMGDQLGMLKGAIVNYVVRKVKKLVPPFSLPGAVRFNDALSKGMRSPFQAPQLQASDMALLQYTGGTTGVSKGAVLLHSNIIANVLQSEAWNQPAMGKVPAGEQPTSICALPLYHIFAFTVNMMLSMRTGGKTILIPNPRDLKSTLKELSGHRFHSFPAVSTLFNGLANHPDFDTVDWSHLKVSVGGGMAVQSAVAQLWLQKTGCPICEGYGLSETSPGVCFNRADNQAFTGTVGYPWPSTDVSIRGPMGNELPMGEIGELTVKGPQVMAGYWNRPDETAKVMTTDGYFRTGDLAIMLPDGQIRIVDRLKEMVLVSGFNVYPNEVEDVIARHPKVREVAVVGLPDAQTGEAVHAYIVKRDDSLTADEIKVFCAEMLTKYKMPKVIAFRTELPKSNVGKVLRRVIREEVLGGGSKPNG